MSLPWILWAKESPSVVRLVDFLGQLIGYCENIVLGQRSDLAGHYPCSYVLLSLSIWEDIDYTTKLCGKLHE